MTTNVLDHQLQAIDPAAGLTARDPEATLREILEANGAPDHSTKARSRPTRRLALVAAAAVALAVVPALSGHDRAYADWTAYPAALSTGQGSAVAQQCQRWARTSITAAPTRVVLSERRGSIGLALLTGPEGLLVTCTQDLGTGEPTGGSSEAHLDRVPSRDGLISDGGSGFAKDDGEPIFRVVSGLVGEDVVSVLVHTAEQGDVTATVTDGYFTAWWPGPPQGANGAPQTSLPMTFTFTAGLRDGTTKDFDRTGSLDPRP